MLQVSQNFKDAMVAPVRTFCAEADVHINASDLGEITTFSQGDAIKTIEIQRVGDNSKFFGFGICQRLNMHIVDLDDTRAPISGTPVKVRLGIVLDDNTIEYISYPTFTVTERNKQEDEGRLSITAYDKLNDASLYTFEDLEISAPYTIKSFVSTIAAYLGLGIDFVNVPVDDYAFNLDYLEGANFEGKENLRECLNVAAEATQTIYYINENDVLIFKRLDVNGAPLATITEDDYFSFNHKDNRRLGEIWHVTELGDNVVAKSGVTLSTAQYVRNNPFWEKRENDIAEVVNNALENVKGLVVSQFDCEWRGNLPLEIGDKVEIKQVASDACIQPTYIFDDVISFDGGYGQKTQWAYSESDAATDGTPSSIGEAIDMTFARVDKVNNTVQLQAQQIDEMSNNISQLSMTTDDIRLSVRNVEQSVTDGLAAANEEIQTLTERASLAITKEEVQIEINTALETGVDKVTTATGYTFNESGLTVSKADSEISTTISEDGMQVARNGETVLTVNNEGVKAEDLHATTYLIVGTNSRFENFDGNRTGCFLIS